MKINYPQTIIEKYIGINQSEEYLSKLCNETFFKLWSYANPFKDKRQHNKGDGRELCDLLVVFGNHILIFSIKEGEFSDNKENSLSWGRWYRGNIEKSAYQVFSAERWIKKYPNRIYLNKECDNPFPLSIPPIEKAKIHRIVVALGASEDCKEYFGEDSSGSFKIDTRVSGDMHLSPDNSFIIGHVNPKSGFVHVLNEITFDILMNTLDTAPDFINYLSKKEELLLQRKIEAAREEDLLATYLTYTNSNNEHYFPMIDNDDLIKFIEGNWKDFSKSPERKRQIEANEISYYWDRLIHRNIDYLITGTHYTMSHPDIMEQEQIIRYMASEDRTSRRLYAHEIIELKELAKGELPSYRMAYNPDKETGYLFLVLQYNNDCFESYEYYRSCKQKLLNMYVYSMKLYLPHSKWILGIGIETNIVCGGTSEDYAYLDTSTWTDDDEKEALENEKWLIKAGFIRERKTYYIGIDEYPQE